MRERVFCRHEDGLQLEVEVARVDSPRAVAQERPERPGQKRLQLRVCQGRERADRVHAGRPQPRLRARPDAGEQADREWGEEPRFRAGRDDRDPARLAAVGGDLAHDLGGTDAERAGEARARANGRPDRGCERTCPREVGRDGAEVEVALVDPRALDARDDLGHRVPDGARVLPVERMAGPDEDRGGAAAERLGCAHRRADTEPPRHVVGGRHDTAPVRVAADHQRLLAELGILELLDGGEECVEVEVREDRHERRLGTCPVSDTVSDT